MLWNLEGLELRRMLSVTVPTSAPVHPPTALGPPPAVVVRGPLLQIHGTRGNDVIAVAPNAADATKLDVTLNGKVTTVKLAGIRRILVQAGAGNDKVTISPAVKIGALINGGRGDDTLGGGAGNDILIGGAGKNSLTGGKGADLFVTHDKTEVTDLNTAEGDKLAIQTDTQMAEAD